MIVGYVCEFFGLLIESLWWMGCEMGFLFYFTLNQTFENVLRSIFKNTPNTVKANIFTKNIFSIEHIKSKNIFQRNKQNVNDICVRTFPSKMSNL